MNLYNIKKWLQGFREEHKEVNKISSNVPVIRSVCDHTFAIHPRFGDLYCTKCYMPKGLIKQTDV